MLYADLSRLLDDCITTATKFVEEFGEFFPFAYVLKITGESVSTSAWDGDEHPPPESVIQQLTSGLRRQAAEGRIIASAICCDVAIGNSGSSEKHDALRVSLEHVNGDAFDIFLPYEKTATGEIDHGEPYLEEKQPVIFI